MPPDTVKTLVPVVFVGPSVCWLIVCVVMLVRQRRKDRERQAQWNVRTIALCAIAWP